jgi:hypothetical protein
MMPTQRAWKIRTDGVVQSARGQVAQWCPTERAVVVMHIRSELGTSFA